MIHATKKGAASPRLLPHFALSSLIATAAFLALTFSLRHVAARQLAQNELTIHESGTFTLIAATV